jgi:hypothetical protein
MITDKASTGSIHHQKYLVLGMKVPVRIEEGCYQMLDLKGMTFGYGRFLNGFHMLYEMLSLSIDWYLFTSFERHVLFIMSKYSH